MFLAWINRTNKHHERNITIEDDNNLSLKLIKGKGKEEPHQWNDFIHDYNTDSVEALRKGKLFSYQLS